MLNGTNLTLNSDVDQDNQCVCFTWKIPKWASSRENLSAGFPTMRFSNQSPQLLRLATKMKFHLYQVYI